ncbi:PadR family transcriptional regulator [Cohnella thailandensis]|uniref:PadR family transcriptional regulator n=1 Tax=Cohnella thailandensis TaxID=557557 RepID=A0A841SUR9_9BACL|nr:PadR family transcriptional regulator [Cohnella thailandensis]MBB6635002.1 PadR family transcriptional regulator [Cohnella thailandensis]MBP1975775.1 DNA-binding PadR family transcriptional regulator [Cohnella thailandensis]
MRGEFKFALLELLGSGPMHGYQLIKAMEEKTGGLYTPSAGSIYPNLQLLEEMGLAGSSEVDGKKLYHITDEGRSHLRERAQNAPVRPEERWERRGMHRFGGELDKRDIRGLAMTWPEAVGLLAQAAREARENPDSEQAARLRGIVSKLQEELKQVLASDSASGEDSAHEGDSRTDSEPLD